MFGTAGPHPCPSLCGMALSLKWGLLGWLPQLHLARGLKAPTWHSACRLLWDKRQERDLMLSPAQGHRPAFGQAPTPLPRRTQLFPWIMPTACSAGSLLRFNESHRGTWGCSGGPAGARGGRRKASVPGCAVLLSAGFNGRHGEGVRVSGVSCLQRRCSLACLWKEGQPSLQLPAWAPGPPDVCQPVCVLANPSLERTMSPRFLGFLFRVSDFSPVARRRPHRGLVWCVVCRYSGSARSTHRAGRASPSF